jgi:protein arginine N-methyltransferase 7
MYSGLDKYAGALVAGSSSSVSLQPELVQLFKTTGAQESLVLENPEDRTQLLLNAQLDPEHGGLSWTSQDSYHPLQRYRSVIGCSQLTSMLHDEERNEAYDKALRLVIQTFQAQTNRAPVVLDIGTGTGLLVRFLNMI